MPELKAVQVAEERPGHHLVIPAAALPQNHRRLQGFPSVVTPPCAGAIASGAARKRFSIWEARTRSVVPSCQIRFCGSMWPAATRACMSVAVQGPDAVSPYAKK